MSVSNRQRRAAKRRKQAKEGRTGSHGRPHSGAGWGDHGWGAPDERALASVLVSEVLRETQDDVSAAVRCAELLLRSDGPVSPAVAAETVQMLLTGAVAAACRGGWAPSDLAEVTRRRLSARHLPALAALLAAEAAGHRDERVDPAWREDLCGLGRARPLELRAPEELALALGLAATLTVLPVIAAVIPPPGALPEATVRTAGADGKVLAKVRSLLAKAESTDFAEEAEALSAKAQELISRYALDRLVDQVGSEAGAAGAAVLPRRIWIDAPYVMAKAMLIDVVAGANRCRSVVSEQLGFSTVIGETSDLDAVELLATSLLVQANTAMLSWGRQSGRRGTTRTSSFRRSFLTAYATRIGERLRVASDQAAEQTGRAGELVPILRRQSEQVRATMDQLFPELFTRTTRTSNGHGWAAGRAAADLASLGTAAAVTEAAS